ncbi:hypothetical protein [Vibrio ezurae]|uniref:Lipocalin-like domain-containing protein n=1 Tax=Vibrio ezurae NBRC 102218 TaxID=1219080 RepID=U3CEJ7_9VIBR|nr:hypothetical protein [Vibrio ezurae]GAD79694.1 hypothetical protein VEZ01S_19_01090 [Vibrio ezurae NBRC 102218]
MNIKGAPLFLLICMSASTASANSSMLTGAWKCSSILPVSWLESVSIYSPDGSIQAFANSITQADHRALEYDFFLEGTWKLEGKVLTTNVEIVEAVAKNADAKNDIDKIKSLESISSKEEIILLNSTQLKTKSESGKVSDCTRVVSAHALKNKS